MQEGLNQSTSDYVLFTDADIQHPKDSLRLLAARAIDNKLDLTSLMVKLHCESTAEKLLIPAFVYFFSMLYPFRRANNPDSSVAAAAGGVMLIRRKALNNIGGLKTIASALIDDCALAKVIKRGGGDEASEGRIELTLARDTKSLRDYPSIKDIKNMIARNAYTQLRHSPYLLAATLVGMTLLFLLPPLLPLTGWALSTEASMGSWIIMIITYLPIVLFYRLPFSWALTLPVAAVIYMAATIDSARLYWQGKGGQWKDRAQAS
jgi:hopene-associated glycosyltransferase HpnB